MPGNTEVKSMRRPPCSLVINNQKDEEHDEKTSVCPHPPKIKMKSSPLIEKLQANLALSPTVLLSPPKSPESKQPPSACSSISSTLQTPQLSCEDEAPVSFEQPVEGTPLPSINKSRARLSFKRRLPTRLHRKSANEDTKVHEGNDSQHEPESQEQNGEELICRRIDLQEDTEEKTDSAQTTTDPQLEKDRTENSIAPLENEAEVTHTGAEEEVTEGGCEPSDCKQAQEEEIEEGRTEVKEGTEVLEAENRPE